MEKHLRFFNSGPGEDVCDEITRGKKSHETLHLTLIRAAGGVYDYRNFQQV